MPAERSEPTDGRGRGAWLPLLLALLVGAGCGGDRPVDVPGETLRSLSLRGRVAQLVTVPLPTGVAGAVEDSALTRLLRTIREDSVGGVWLRGGSAMTAALLLDTLQRAAPLPLPLLVGADLDRGLGAGSTTFPLARAVAALASSELTAAMGRHTAREAAAIGVHLGLVAVPATNGTEPISLFARDVARTSRGLASYLEAAGEEGLRTGVAALWTEGRDTAVRVLQWDRARLEAVELALLRDAVEAGADAILLGAVAVPALTGDTVPLPLSATAVQGLLRRDLGWEGLVLADLRAGSPLRHAYGSVEAAVRAVSAGADLLLSVDSVAAVVDGIIAAVEDGRLPRSRVDSAALRVLRMRAALPVTPADTIPPALRSADALEVAWRASLRTALELPAEDGDRPSLRGAVGALLVRPVGRGRALATALGRHVPALEDLTLNLSADSAALLERLVEASGERSALVLADFPVTYGRPLRELVRQAAPDDSVPRETVRLHFAPPFIDGVPADEPGLVAWGVGALTQHAVAGLLFEEPEPDRGPEGPLVWPPAPILRRAAAEEVGMDGERLARVDEVIEEAIEDSVFPGAALAVGRRGGVVRLRGYGRLGYEPGSAPVSAGETLFDLASLSKILGTTTAVAILVEEGRMSLDAPLGRYLPGFRGEGKDGVTVRRLLTHTSGLPPGLWLYGSAGSPREALQQVLRQPLEWEPGERVEYSDLGMILLAEAAERAAGMPLDRFLARRVFAPLGMSSTMYLPRTTLRGRTAPTATVSERDFTLRAVVHDANAFRLGGVAGHAGLFSTARDVAVFAQTMLNRGSYGTVPVLSSSTAAEFTTRQPGAEQRALGWDTPSRVSSSGRYFSSRSFGHTGYTGTSLWIDPEKDLFVVLLTNRTYAEASAREILRVRQAVHDAVARAITDQEVVRRR